MNAVRDCDKRLDLWDCLYWHERLCAVQQVETMLSKRPASTGFSMIGTA